MRTLRRAAIAFTVALVVIGSLGVVSADAASLSKDWTQCSNTNPTLGVCVWINGIVQQSNSTYYEGMGVPQRAFFDNVPATGSDNHALTFAHQATKGGIHAYDFLMSYPQVLTTAAAVGNPFSTLNECIAGPSSPATFAADCATLRAGSNHIDVVVPDDAFVSKDGGTQSHIDAFESAYGNRTIRIWGNAPFTAGALTLAHSVTNGNDTADSDINYNLTWTSASTKILVEMAGHISMGPDGGIGWGPGLGASSISGGPYHFHLDTLDGASLGSMDNQLKGADVLVATTISTTPVPASGLVGTVIHDTATVAGSDPGGTVTYKLYPPSDPTCAGSPVLTSTKTLSNGLVPDSATFVTNAVGVWHWTADYSGDAHNAASSSSCADEAVTISKGNPTIATDPVPASAVVGASIHDTATLTGGAAPVGGTVTYRLYGPGDPTCAGTVLLTSVKTVSAGVVPSSDSFVTTLVGTYHWTAAYSGDANNNATTSGCEAEPVVSSKASPTIATVPSAGGVVGVAVHDTATLSGGFAPLGGTVTYRLFPPTDPTCAGAAVLTSTKTVSSGVVPNSDSFNTNAVGTWHWTAEYSGDGANNPTTSPCAAETVVTTKASPSIATVPSSGGVVGVSVHDTSTLTGGFAPITGTVTYKLFPPSDPTCAGAASSTSTKTVSGGVVPNSDSFVTNAVGTWHWTAAYSGDANNNGATSPCAAETVTTTKASPNIATVPSDGGVVGVVLHDTATLTGGYAPVGGTVTYKLFGPADQTCAGSALLTSTKTVTAGVVPNSDTWSTVAAGTYHWIAVYSGDANNNADTSTCEEEVVIATKASPSIATVPSAGGIVGTVIHDTATLTGGFAPLSGTVTYKLFGPSDPTCAGAAALTSTKTVTAGVVPASDTFATNAIGVWRWTAVYSGDGNNNGATSACGAENVEIGKAQPSIATVPSAGGVVGVVLHDTATLTGGFDPMGGSVTYTLYGPADLTCDGSPLMTSTKSVTSGVVPNSDNYTSTLAGIYHWIAVYSGDANNNAASSGCELESVTTTKASPAIATTPSAGGNLGKTITDVAAVTGGFSPTGTVTFALFGPNDATCAGTPIFTSAAIPLVSGVATSPAFRPTAAGLYQWVATYGGDANNVGVAGLCGAEPVTMTAVLPVILKKTGTDDRMLLVLATALLAVGLALMSRTKPVGRTALGVDPRAIVSSRRRRRWSAVRRPSAPWRGRGPPGRAGT